MAKPTPARITFTNDTAGLEGPEVEQQIRFHSVVLEGHKARSKFTKFPVMTGFEVSRHAIKKNRQVVIKAMVSNVLLNDSNNNDVRTSNTTRTLHEACAALVDNATVCRVVTNLGVYDPVVFDSYDTETKIGYTDCIEIILKGEKLQVKGALNKTAPKPLSFRVLSDSEKAVRIDELATGGIEVDPEAELSESVVQIGTDFTIATQTSIGETTTSTYQCTGQDPTTAAYSYDVHTSLSEIAGTPETSSFNFFTLVDGAATASACLVEGLVDYGTDELVDIVHTELGDLKKSVYGAYYEAIELAGDGGPLLSIGIDCIIAGVIGGTTGTTSPDDFDTTLPDADDIAGAANLLGNFAANDLVQVIAPTTFTKISVKSNDNILGDLL